MNHIFLVYFYRKKSFLSRHQEHNSAFTPKNAFDWVSEVVLKNSKKIHMKTVIFIIRKGGENVVILRYSTNLVCLYRF